MSRTRTYLDHASSSPLRPEGLAAMTDALRDLGGDPGRMHAEGMTARVALEQAREPLAALLGARGREVIFTSGATEAIAAVCHGVAGRPGRQVFGAVEHSAVRTAAARHGEHATIPVDVTGRIDLDALTAALATPTSVVHVQWANHEVGTVQPVAEAVALAHEHGALVHVDAAQAVGRLPVDFASSGIDLLSLSGPKFGAPPGTGALLVRRGLRIDPLLVGGDQERARRAGLENVPACVGLGAVAAVLADPAMRDAEAARATAQTERLIEVLGAVEGVRVLGHPTERSPHLVCLSISDVEPQAVILGLDRVGIAAHSGSACATESLEPSPVLDAMGVDASHSLRLSVGWSTTDADVDWVCDALPEVLAGLRALRR